MEKPNFEQFSQPEKAGKSPEEIMEELNLAIEKGLQVELTVQSLRDASFRTQEVFVDEIKGDIVFLMADTGEGFEIEISRIKDIKAEEKPEEK